MKNTLKDKPRVKKVEEMLSPKANQGVPLREVYHTWNEKWTK